jgi:hypothetical protein
MGLGSQSHAPAALPPGITRWMDPRPGLDRRGKSGARIGIQSSDRPARSQSLYRLSYPDSHHLLLRCMTVFQ